MLAGDLHIGARQPVRGVPAWATLEVAHGGFATGTLLAGGPLLPHERALLAEVSAPPPGVSERAHLNVFFLSDEGRQRLGDMRDRGTFRVTVPEEGALLVLSFLLEHGEAAQAESLLEEIAPFFDRLRFYPVPDAKPLGSTAVVSVSTVGPVRQALAARAPQPQVARMNQALTVWLPLYDKVVSLFLETVKGPAPTFVRDQHGKKVLRPDRQPLVQGGVPCHWFPEGFAQRAEAISATYTQLRQTHGRDSVMGATGTTRTTGPDRKAAPEPISPNMATLLAYASAAGRGQSTFGPTDVARIRRALAGFVTKHGAPGSARHMDLRARQADWSSRPLHHELAHVLGERLASLPADAALASTDGLASMVTADEAARVPSGRTAGDAIPLHLLARLGRCVEGTIDELVRRRIVTSGEVLAKVLPQMTSQVRALGVSDPTLRRVYAATYAAFRARRSLLLLELASQVKLDELPWIAALAPYRTAEIAEKTAARMALEQVVTLHLSAFPETIFPNKLVTELVALAKSADLAIPITNELAADIFMGRFSDKYVAAARVAATVMSGSLYERYYGIPYDQVRGLGSGDLHGGAELASLCMRLSGQPDLRTGTPAQNGRVIEQQQIVTTHDLAQLFLALDLGVALRSDLRHLAERAFHATCKLLAIAAGAPVGRTALRAKKDAAYALRQMLFFLSFVSDDELFAFSIWAEETVSAQPPSVEAVLGPIWRGISHVTAGGSFDESGMTPDGGRRFLGWG
jgi:hypothetical protein